MILRKITTENAKHRVKNIDGVYSPRKVKNVFPHVFKNREQKISKQKTIPNISKITNVFNFKLKNRIWLKRSVAAVTLLATVSLMYFQNTPGILGATYTWNQMGWDTNAMPGSTITHPSTGTTYESKTNTDTATAGQVLLTQNTNNFSETFTSTTYDDTGNTDANWNTSAGQLEMGTEPVGTNLYEKLNGYLAGGQIISQVKADNEIYIGATNGKFLKYDIVSDTAIDLTSKIVSFWGSTNIHVQSLAYDSLNKVIYLAGVNSKFARYNTSSYIGGGTYPSPDTAYDLNAKISSFWNVDIVYSLSFDSNENVLYLAGNTGKFARYNTTFWNGSGTCSSSGQVYAANVACNLAPSVASFWSTSPVNSLTIDSVNNVIYLGGASGKFAKYTISTDTSADLTSQIASFWSTNAVGYMTYDYVNSVVYLGSTNYNKFARYNTTAWSGSGTCTATGQPYAADTACDLTTKVSGFLGTGFSVIVNLTLDVNNGVIYIGGYNGKLVRYNTSTYSGSGTYPTADTAYDLTNKISAFWSTNAISTIVFDPVGGDVYFGGASGKFGKYNIGSDVVTNLTSKVNGVEWNVATVNKVIEGDNNNLYIAGGVNSPSNVKFARYNTQTGVAEDLSSKVISAIGGNLGGVYSLAYDQVNKVVYLGCSVGKFVRYNTAAYSGGGTYPTANTAYDLTAKAGFMSSNYNSIIRAIVVDSANGTVYAGGGYNGTRNFVRYNMPTYTGGGVYPTADTGYDLTSKLSPEWNATTEYVYSLALDATNNAVYIGGPTNKFAKYGTSSDIATILTARISSFWNNNTVSSLAFDSSSNVLYMGSSAARLARYNTDTYVGGGTYPMVDTAYDLSTKISYWSAGVVIIALDSANNNLYLCGTSGKFARYSIGGDFVTNLRLPDTLSFWGSVTVNSLVISNSNVYIVGASGYFAEKPPINSSTSAYSLAVDNFPQDIYYATLTKNDTVDTGSVAYYLSNNGGVDWEQVTPAVEHAFATVGSDLRFKITVSGNATVQDLTITYWSYNSSGELISSAYDTDDAANLVGKIAWQNDLSRMTNYYNMDGDWNDSVGNLDGTPVGATFDTGKYGASSGSFNGSTTYTDVADVFTDSIKSDDSHSIEFWFKANADQGGAFLFDIDDGLPWGGVGQYMASLSDMSNITWSIGGSQRNYALGSPLVAGNWYHAAFVKTAAGNNGEFYLNGVLQTPSSGTLGNTPSTDGGLRIGKSAHLLGYGLNGKIDELAIYDESLSAGVVASHYQKGINSPGTEIKFQVRTAPDNAGAPGNWSSWKGPNGTSGSYFTDATGGEAMPSDFTDSVDDQWLQYKATLNSDGAYTPILTDVTTTYVVNATPQVQGVSASQDADGIINVSLGVKDLDTADPGAADPGKVYLTLQYCTLADCTSPGPGDWADATTVIYKDGGGTPLPGNTNHVDVNGSSFINYQIAWTPKTDFDNQYVSDFKIRVRANDSEGANNLGYGSSGTFTFDTTNPTIYSFNINHTTNQLTLTTPTDDSSFQMSVSNVAGSFPIFESFVSPYDYSSLTSDPATVYVRIKDTYGNYTDAQATTPAKPNNPIYYDTSNEPQGIFQEFIAWDVVSASQVGAGFSSYKIYRQTDSGLFVLLATITDRNTNYYLDKIHGTDTESDPAFDQNNPSSYTYKIVTTDIDGNISAFSQTVTDTPNGVGGSDSTPPTITNVTVININTTSAKVSWTTDELSDSSVGYSTDTSYLPERGLASMVLNHEIVLTGLTPGTTYNIRVKSHDQIGNLGQNDKDAPGASPIPNFTFSTHPGPAISQVTIPNISNHQATITWKTTTDANTYVVYSNTIANSSLSAPEEVGVPTLVGGNSPYDHTQIISTYNNADLVANTIYYFYVKSVDGSNNVATDDNGGNFYQFLTTEDTIPPIINGVDAIIKNNTEAAINWSTNESADSKVIYSENQGGPYSSQEIVTTYDQSHYVILTGLTSDTTYYYQVISKDINGNETISDEYEFMTLKDPGFQHDPLSSISNVAASIITDNKAVITFDTDQGALCLIQSGNASGNYTNDTAKEDGYDDKLKFNEHHSIPINSLIFSTKYYYKISCLDNLDTAIESGEYDFTTSEKLYTESGADALGDHTPPEISGVGAKSTSGESVTVTWDTNEVANSLVKYGITSGTYENVAGDGLVLSDTANFDATHSVIVNNLTPATKYYYVVVSYDLAGNVSESAESSFTTKSASTLSGIEYISTKLGEVTITWKSSQKTTSVVRYGETEAYTDVKENNTYATEHSIVINNLKSNIKYFYRVEGKDQDNNLYSSQGLSFTPKSPPQISNITIADITERTAKIKFNTNVPTDALIIYTSSNDAKNAGSQGDPQLSSSHEVELKDLNPGSTYTIKIKVKDEQGNDAEDSENKSFTAGKDSNPPEIDQVKTDSALSQSDKVQTIISWVTNEPATGAIIYKESLDGEEKEVKISEEYSANHSTVFTVFKPGSVYYFKTKSKDQSGNETVSKEYALLTPKRRENIIQIIISNFQGIFSWVKF